MELRDCVRAIAGRWVWVAASGLAGALLAATVGLLTPAAWSSTATLYVDAAVVAGPQDPSSAARVRTTVLPSVAALASASSVLERAAGTLRLPDSPGDLAADLDVTVEEDASVLHVTATRPTPEEAADVAREVGAQVRRAAGDLFAGTGDGPSLRVTVVRDSAAPVPASRPATVLTVLGALAAAGAAALAAALAELARPRVRGREDVARLTTAPALGVLPAGLPRTRSGNAPRRPEEVARLRWALRATPPDGAAHRVALLGPGTTSLAAELTSPGLDAVPVDGASGLLRAGPVDSVVVVADGRRTTAAQLEEALATAATAGVPLAGVVVDGLLPPGAGPRALLRAGARGDATWRLDGRAGPGHRPAGARASVPAQVVAALGVAMVGFTRPLPMGLMAGMLAAVALLPLWLPVVRRTRGLLVLLVLTGVGLLSGVLLALGHAGDHGFVLNEAAVRVCTVLATVGGVGVLVWARGLLPVPVLGTVFGLAMLATELLGEGADNVWKFQLSSPLTVVALSLAVAWGRPVLTVAVLAVLGLLDVANDARSAFGFCVVAAALVLWQRRPLREGPVRPGRRWLAVPVLGALGASGYWLLTQLMLAGALGADIQQRTAVQIAQTGSLILGGRPEWAATWALAQVHPFGFGLGTVPNSQDVLVGEAGIAVTGIPTAGDYLVHYLLDGGVELHSIVADLWAGLGPAGALLGLAMGVLVVTGLADRLARRQASGLVCLLVPMALWGLPFGPMASNADTLTLALGLLLLPRAVRASGGSPDGGRDRAPSAARTPVPA
ncbi:hypothetical protein [Geodermatophilus amargosae]|uniref:hypothetical protein n=1 Tax=Geodermatophilus amargosae TaxID=1296565 RepID=UPI0034E006AB